jgi:hydrophobe/amphiphile efflux-1 (HAE1) family protein
MNISERFIRRPIATSLVMMGLLFFGAASYTMLPVAALPDVDFPTITVQAALPGASPDTMATTIATPLEQQFAAIPGLVAMTSWSGLGNTSITLQFALDRSIDGAATDVQTAINSAGGLLPKDMPTPPIYRKVNAADQPVLIYAVHSDDMPLYKIDDYAFTVLAQKISAISGIAQVTIGGQQDFAVRIRADPAALASHGISMEDIRKGVAAATINQAKGTIEGKAQALILDANDQLFEASGYRDVIVAFRNGAPVRIRDIAEVIDGARLPRTGAWYNGKKAEVLLIFRQPGANITKIVDQVRATMPDILASLPPALHVDLMSDRSLAVEASIADVKFTLILTIALVVMVILIFLRHFWATVIPSIAVPLALVATFAVMYALGYSVNNLTLMAMTIAVGFVVDDAIVMIENIVRYIEKGDSPLEAALKGSGEIGFTIVSITISLVAVFIPLLLMGGMVGVLFREFAVTVTAAVIMSAFVSLTLTPVMCARFLHHPTGERKRSRIDQACENAFNAVQHGYDRGLVWVLDHQPLTLAATVALAVLTGWLYMTIPKGLFPQQDTGFVFITVEGRQDISFAAMVERQGEVTAALLQDPAVQSVVAFAGTGPIVPSENLVRMFVQLRPQSERRVSADQFIQRIRPELAKIQDLNVYLQVSQDLTFGGRLSRTQYQYTLTSLDSAELNHWAPILGERLRGLSKLQDNASDQQIAARHLAVEVDRDTASRLGVSLAAIDQTLYDTFGERQVATIYSATTQYKVLLESAGQFERGPAALSRLYVPGAAGVQVPLSTVARFTDTVAPLTINHQGQFPAVTLSFNLAPGAALSEAVAQINQLRDELNVPPTVNGAFQGMAQVFQDSLKSTPLLILAAIIAVYIVLGVLYESYIHPITILSALPSAGVGALLALMAFGYDLSVIALIGIILLIGIVKKNAIMMIDFALKAERDQGMSPREAIHQACLLRFRPIMMTTFAAIGGGLPLALGQGAGSELRHPLGIAIVGGLLVSQWLTLYTTPVVYLYLDRLSRWLSRGSRHRKVAAE